MTADDLRAENEELRWRLEEAEEMLRAIRSGAVDAVVVGGADGRRVYTLDGADRAYRVWVEQMSQGAATLAPDGTVAYCNPRLAALLGTPFERLVGQPLRGFVAAADRPRYDGLLRDGRAGAGQGEFLLTRADSTPVPVLLTATALPPDSGAAIGLLVTDLTAQKHHETLAAALAALRTSEERFRTLFDTMDEGFCVVEVLFDAAGRPVDYRFLEMNPAFEKHTGLRSAAGRTARELVPDLDASWFEIYGRVVVTGEPVRFVNEAKAMDDRWFDVYAFRLGGPDSRKVAILFNDITARRRSEERVRESERRFREFADTAPAMLWVTGPDARCSFLSRGWYEFTGQSEPEALGFGWLAAVHPDDREAAGAAFRAANGRREAFALEHRVRRADGTDRWVIDAGRPRFAPAGEFLGYVGSVIDITDRKAAEERFAFVRQSSGVGFWYCDLPFDVLEWDEHVKAHFHLPPDARVTIHTFYDRLHPADREPTRAAIERSIAGRTPYDVDYRTVDPATGAERWVRAFGRTFYADDGTPTRFDGVTLDITDRKRAEETTRFLADVSAALAELVDHRSTLQRVAAQAVPAFADWCVVAMPAGGDWERLVVTHADPDDARAAQELVQRYPPRPDDPHGVCRALRTGEPELVADVSDRVLRSLAHDDEHLRLLRGSRMKSFVCVPLTSRGATLGALAFVTGEFGRRYTPADLAVAEDLARRATVAIENASLYRALQDADRRKDEFLATLAHELRNPLAPLRNGLQVLRLANGDAAAVAAARGMMDRQLGHMVRLIDDLLDVSRISRNKMALRRERVALADVVAAAVETARPAVEAAGHALAVALPPDPVWLDADLTRLGQVFSNLLTNSAKYTEPGGRIRLAAAADGGEAVVTVADTGIGIPRDALPGVFDMFSQVDRSHERAAGGLGIGLALVKGLTEMHGGTVTADSPGPGQGSTFTVRLPTATAGPAAPAPSANGSPAAATRRVLVVDDNRDAAESMAAMLGLLGNEVHTAHDGVQAVEAAERVRPDVILMDIGMPRLNGLDATRRIRGLPWGRGVTVVALTGWGQDADRLRSKEAGCDGHLVKPVGLADLQKLLSGLHADRPSIAETVSP